MEKTMKLWCGDVPGYIDGEEVPMLTYHPAEDKRGDGTVLIFAGGAYRGRASHEGVGYARYLNGQGLDAFVLDYRVKPYRFPYPLLDARRAIRLIRDGAEEFGIDPGKVAVMGSSAGGHLAALVSTYKEGIDGEGVDAIDGIDCMPNMQILCYPVLDMLGHSGSFVNLLGDDYHRHRRITPYLLAERGAPEMFLWHTASDGAVDLGNSLRYATRLHELGVNMEMHIYPVGQHGLGLANIDENNRNVPYVQSWAMHLTEWLRLKGWIKE